MRLFPGRRRRDRASRAGPEERRDVVGQGGAQRRRGRVALGRSVAAVFGHGRPPTACAPPAARARCGTRWRRRPRPAAGRLGDPGQPAAPAHAAALRPGARLGDVARGHPGRAAARAALHLVGPDEAGAGRGEELHGQRDARADRDRQQVVRWRRDVHAARALERHRHRTCPGRAHERGARGASPMRCSTWRCTTRRSAAGTPSTPTSPAPDPARSRHQDGDRPAQLPVHVRALHVLRRGRGRALVPLPGPSSSSTR